jgi:hypothetical protein
MQAPGLRRIKIATDQCLAPRARQESRVKRLEKLGHRFILEPRGEAA